jgi:hypothetical protein
MSDAFLFTKYYEDNHKSNPGGQPIATKLQLFSNGDG